MADISVASFTRALATNGVTLTLRWVRATGAWSAPARVGSATLINAPDGGAGPTHQTADISWAAPAVTTTTNANDTVTLVGTLQDRKGHAVDTLTATGPQGLITDGTDTTPAFTAQAVTNGSTQAYLRPTAAEPCCFGYFAPVFGSWPHDASPSPIWAFAYASGRRKWVMKVRVLFDSPNRGDMRPTGAAAYMLSEYGLADRFGTLPEANDADLIESAATRIVEFIEYLWLEGVIPEGDGYVDVMPQWTGSGSDINRKLFEHPDDFLTGTMHSNAMHLDSTTGREDHRTFNVGVATRARELLSERNVPCWPGLLSVDYERDPPPYEAINSGGGNWSEQKAQRGGVEIIDYAGVATAALTIDDCATALGDPNNEDGAYREDTTGSPTNAAWSRGYWAWSRATIDCALEYAYYVPWTDETDGFPNCRCSDYDVGYYDHATKPYRFRNNWGVPSGSNAAIWIDPAAYADIGYFAAHHHRPLCYYHTSALAVGYHGGNTADANLNLWMAQIKAGLAASPAGVGVMPEYYMAGYEGGTGPFAGFHSTTLKLLTWGFLAGVHEWSGYSLNANRSQTENDWQLDMDTWNAALAAAGLTP